MDRRSFPPAISLPVLLLASFVFWACGQNQKAEATLDWATMDVAAEGRAEAVEEIIKPYRDSLDAMMNEVVGEASHDLLTNDGDYESTLGVFVTNLLYEESCEAFKCGVDVAVMNHHGGLRAPLMAGQITLGEIYKVMPFENEMIVVEVPGPMMKVLFDHIGKSGRSMAVPARFTVTDRQASDILIKGKPLDESKTYHVAISDYLAGGGGGYQFLKTAKRVSKQSVKLRDMIVAHVKKLQQKGLSAQASLPGNITTITTP